MIETLLGWRRAERPSCWKIRELQRSSKGSGLKIKDGEKAGLGFIPSLSTTSLIQHPGSTIFSGQYHTLTVDFALPSLVRRRRRSPARRYPLQQPAAVSPSRAETGAPPPLLGEGKAPDWSLYIGDGGDSRGGARRRGRPSICSHHGNVSPLSPHGPHLT
jgi:hypothetical protein